jgi:hypothetical protein
MDCSSLFNPSAKIGAKPQDYRLLRGPEGLAMCKTGKIPGFGDAATSISSFFLVAKAASCSASLGMSLFFIQCGRLR